MSPVRDISTLPLTISSMPGLQLAHQERLVEPHGDRDRAVVLERRLDEHHLLVRAASRADVANAHARRLDDPGCSARSGTVCARVLVAPRQVEEQVADRAEPELLEPLRLTRTDADDARERQVEVERHVRGGDDRDDVAELTVPPSWQPCPLSRRPGRQLRRPPGPQYAPTTGPIRPRIGGHARVRPRASCASRSAIESGASA